MPIWSLERLFDPADAIEAQEREKKAEVRYSTSEDDGDPPSYRCRLCNTEAPEPRFCQHCLAETMEAVPQPTAK